jgi:hypothetical protein
MTIGGTLSWPFLIACFSAVFFAVVQTLNTSAPSSNTRHSRASCCAMHCLSLCFLSPSSFARVALQEGVRVSQAIRKYGVVTDKETIDGTIGEAFTYMFGWVCRTPKTVAPLQKMHVGLLGVDLFKTPSGQTVQHHHLASGLKFTLREIPGRGFWKGPVPERVHLLPLCLFPAYSSNCIHFLKYTFCKCVVQMWMVTILSCLIWQLNTVKKEGSTDKSDLGMPASKCAIKPCYFFIAAPCTQLFGSGITTCMCSESSLIVAGRMLTFMNANTQSSEPKWESSCTGRGDVYAGSLDVTYSTYGVAFHTLLHLARDT